MEIAVISRLGNRGWAKLEMGRLFCLLGVRSADLVISQLCDTAESELYKCKWRLLSLTFLFNFEPLTWIYAFSIVKLWYKCIQNKVQNRMHVKINTIKYALIGSPVNYNYNLNKLSVYMYICLPVQAQLHLGANLPKHGKHSGGENTQPLPPIWQGRGLGLTSELFGEDHIVTPELTFFSPYSS